MIRFFYLNQKEEGEQICSEMVELGAVDMRGVEVDNGWGVVGMHEGQVGLCSGGQLRMWCGGGQDGLYGGGQVGLCVGGQVGL